MGTWRGRAAAAVAVASLAFGGCGGESFCQIKCREIREQLIRDFAVSADELDCSDGKWRAADTCQECVELLTRGYAVGPTDWCR